MKSATPHTVIFNTKENKLVLAKQLRRGMTTAERILWSQLRSNCLRNYHIRRQVPIEGFIVDFYCHEARLAIDLDGDVHNDQSDYDAERDQILAQAGILVVRFPNEQVRTQLNKVILRIPDLLERRTICP